MEISDQFHAMGSLHLVLEHTF